RESRSTSRGVSRRARGRTRKGRRVTRPRSFARRCRCSGARESATVSPRWMRHRAAVPRRKAFRPRGAPRTTICRSSRAGLGLTAAWFRAASGPAPDLLNVSERAEPLAQLLIHGRAQRLFALSGRARGLVGLKPGLALHALHDLGFEPPGDG